MPKIITIRPDDIDAAHIEALKVRFNQAAASRALLIAAAKTPALIDALTLERKRNWELTRKMERILNAVTTRQSATQDIVEWIGEHSDAELRRASHNANRQPRQPSFVDLED